MSDATDMNGARRLVDTLIANGVTVCFANPGTSEMQLVAAMDATPGLRAILALFEGVATAAADGYARMAGEPAAVLLHLGPGFGNGLANIHNAGKALTPMINLVGDHATYHLEFDAPLTADVAGIVAPVSDWVGMAGSADDLATKGAEAISAARAGKIATLIVPANHAWDEVTDRRPVSAPEIVTPSAHPPVEAAAEALRQAERPLLFIGGPAMRGEALNMVGRIAAATKADIVCDTFPSRLERGVGRPPVARLPYFAEAATAFLSTYSDAVIVGTKSPVAFFAYPGKASTLMPEHVREVMLAPQHADPVPPLRALAEAVGADEEMALQTAILPKIPDGRLDAAAIGAVLAHELPEDAILVEEAITCAEPIIAATRGAARHDWLALTGGAIGIGLPLAAGAAVACPARKVIAVQADGSGLYTVQALWTMARERLDVTSVILDNASYAVLNIELERVGVTEPGETARSLFNLDRPAIDWVQVSQGFGVPAMRVETVAEFRSALREALADPGPRLIDAAL